MAYGMLLNFTLQILPKERDLKSLKCQKTHFLLAQWLTAFKHALGLRRACEAQQMSKESSRFRTTHQCTLVGQRLRMPSCRKEIGGNHGENVVNTRNMIRCSSWGQGRFQKVKVPASSSRE